MLFHPEIAASGLAAITALFIWPRSRKLILLTVRINAFFGTALFGYIFLNRRSKHWEPLKVRRRWFFVRE
jgi:hypothetical protein